MKYRYDSSKLFSEDRSGVGAGAGSGEEAE